jgi:hypothetical protein
MHPNLNSTGSFYQQQGYGFLRFLDGVGSNYRGGWGQDFQKWNPRQVQQFKTVMPRANA